MSVHRLRAALCAPLLLACTLTASAHAVLERREAAPDAFYKAVAQITHGCGASPTTSVSVTIPEGAVGARPLAKPGWTITTKRGAYAREYPFVHGAIKEGVQEITWSGNTLPPDQFDEFVFSVRLSNDFKAGETVYFPIRQTCETGSYNWAQIPAAGQDAHALAEPAPGVTIVAPARMAQGQMPATTGSTGAPSVKIGALTIEQPWLRATPSGAKVAGGYLRITNTGSSSDRLVSTSIPVAGRGEVHEMSMEGGIMKMAPVDGGLEIKPGASVELKPGGFHLMFMDLRAGLKEGETVKVTLTFEKAGAIDVAFPVAAIGARGPAAAHDH